MLYIVYILFNNNEDEEFSVTLGTSPPKARETVHLVLDFESRLETCQLDDLWQVTRPL